MGEGETYHVDATVGGHALSPLVREERVADFARHVVVHRVAQDHGRAVVAEDDAAFDGTHVKARRDPDGAHGGGQDVAGGGGAALDALEVLAEEKRAEAVCCHFEIVALLS